jgi:predicted alpha/beta hydrolase family esterase
LHFLFSFAANWVQKDAFRFVLRGVTMATRVLVIPGLYDSGDDHWQTHWVNTQKDFKRLVQDEWEQPRAADWVARLDEEVSILGADIVLVGHSLSCCLIGLWAEKNRRKVKGALLVAPTDTEAKSFPKGPIGFAPMPLMEMSFPSIVVASTDDPWVSLSRAEHFAKCWGCDFVSVGATGHINAASQLGLWHEGLALLKRLL